MTNKSVVLLGAGASSEFLIPTMTGLTRKFEREYSEYRASIRRAKNALRKVGFPSNIETILSFAQGSLDPRKAILRSNPFVSSFVTPNTRLLVNKRSSRLVSSIKDFISKECTLSEDYRIGLVVKLYRDFFSHIIKQFKIRNLGDSKSPYPDLDLFATNYDNVVEQYCYHEGREPFFGYTELGDKTAIFTPEYYDSFQGIRLYKLHGSVTIGTLANDRTFYSRQGLRLGDYVAGIKIVDRVMIYGYEKIPSHDPYFENLHRLKRAISSADYVMVIGYSFSDFAILTILRNAISERQGRLRLLILSPHCAKIRKQKFDNSPFVRPIPGNFTDFARLTP